MKRLIVLLTILGVVFGQAYAITVERAIVACDDFLKKGNFLGSGALLVTEGVYYTTVRVKDKVGYVVASDPVTGEVLDVFVVTTSEGLYDAFYDIARSLGVEDHLFLVDGTTTIQVQVSNPIVLSHLRHLLREEPTGQCAVEVGYTPFSSELPVWVVRTDRKLGFQGVTTDTLNMLSEHHPVGNFMFYADAGVYNAKLFMANMNGTLVVLMPNKTYYQQYRRLCNINRTCVSVSDDIILTQVHNMYWYIVDSGSVAAKVTIETPMPIFLWTTLDDPTINLTLPAALP